MRRGREEDIIISSSLVSSRGMAILVGEQEEEFDGYLQESRATKASKGRNGKRKQDRRDVFGKLEGMDMWEEKG